MIDSEFINEQLEILKQPIQNRYVRIDLLDFNYYLVDTLEGRCFDGNITIDANSDVRRTGNVSLVVDKATFNVESGGKIFLDRYIRLYVGSYDATKDNISWINCGLFLIDSPSYSYNAVTNTLSLSLLDLMSKLTGARDGYIEGIPVVIKAGEDIADAMISTLRLGGFDRFAISALPSPGIVPFDLEFGQGTTVYEILKALMELYPGYEMFFDIDGVFTCRPIPDGKGDEVAVGDELWDLITVNEALNVDFNNVKNYIEVYGRTHDPAFFSTETTVTSTSGADKVYTIKLKIDGVKEYSENVIYGFTIKNVVNMKNIKIQINDLAAEPVYLEDGATKPYVSEESGEIYFCVQYKKGYWNWLGHLQAYAVALDENTESPFYVGNDIGVIRLPLFGGEYDNIYSDDLARQRANYELYLHSTMNNTVTLSCLPVYWLDVNMLVTYTQKRKEIADYYLIKSINIGLAPSSVMTVNMTKNYLTYKPVPPTPKPECDVEWGSDTGCFEWNSDDESNSLDWS